MNRREFRQQTLSAIQYLNVDPTLSGATRRLLSLYFADLLTRANLLA